MVQATTVQSVPLSTYQTEGQPPLHTFFIEAFFAIATSTARLMLVGVANALWAAAGGPSSSLHGWIPATRPS